MYHLKLLCYYSTWTLRKLVIYVFVFLFQCMQNFPNLDFIMVTTFCSWNHFETQEHSSVVFCSGTVNQKAFPRLSHTHFWEVPQYRLSVCGGLSSWICTEALKPCLLFLKYLKMASLKLKPGEHYVRLLNSFSISLF